MNRFSSSQKYLLCKEEAPLANFKPEGEGHRTKCDSHVQIITKFCNCHRRDKSNFGPGWPIEDENGSGSGSVLRDRRSLPARYCENQASSFVSPQAIRRGFSTNPEKIVASVLFERLPVVIPKIDPVVYAFREFSFRWQQQYRRIYPNELLDKSNTRGKGDYQIDYVPAPRITEADKMNDKKSLQRALDRRLYLLLYGPSVGAPDGKPVWHFPEKAYDSEDTLRRCAESALQSVVGDLSNTYFVGNAPMGHMIVQSTENASDFPPLKRFFYKSQVIETNQVRIKKCEDFVWVTKDEVMEYFPEQREFLSKMIIS